MVLLLSGCAEGFLWRTGYLSPYVRRTWQEEEQIASTLFTRKQQMTDSVDSALAGSASQQDEIAQRLKDVIFRDPIVLLRLHAVQQLGRLSCPNALDALQTASKDRNTEIRVAAARSLGKMAHPDAIPILQEVIGSDMNGDVRLAATQAMGSFSSVQSLEALSIAIEDKDPALQVAAIESLEKVTGQNLGPDVFAWKNYLSSHLPSSSSERTANRTGDGDAQIR